MIVPRNRTKDRDKMVNYRGSIDAMWRFFLSLFIFRARLLWHSRDKACQIMLKHPQKKSIETRPYVSWKKSQYNFILATNLAVVFGVIAIKLIVTGVQAKSRWRRARTLVTVPFIVIRIQHYELTLLYFVNIATAKFIGIVNAMTAVIVEILLDLWDSTFFTLILPQMSFP